ncbi:hypothetical protein [Alkalicoccus luteus]|uniref:Uncharacterized protein n=1 Tax=Alkalicoccus luteus TaxID=1237094 RepID=A0A969TWV5_9BACI|nr:hypothetical protein [Alkalicoccus luteus]NJP37644.1 hypothetical protein [Alkalicoccus luteus]
MSSYFVTVYSQILFAVWLITAGTIFWTLDKRSGFQLLYLTVLSLSLGYIILMYFPFLLLSNDSVPFTHPHIQATVTLFAFLIPLCRRKTEAALCISAAAAVSLIYLLAGGVPVFTVTGGILIGGFISYTFYRSLEWIGSMPDAYLFSFAIILPFFLALLLAPDELFLVLPGLLLGTGIGAVLEQYKVRMFVEQTGVSAKWLASVIGAAGILFVHFGVRPAFDGFLIGDVAAGLFLGLWITIILPFIMVVSGLYVQYGRGEKII